jgi:hypothetical protein
MRLGKKPGTVEDRRTLRLASFLDPDEVQIPDRWRIASGTHDWPLLGNDRYGDCTCAAMGHRIIAQEASSRQREARPNVVQTLTVYSAVSGFRIGDPSSDQGAYLIDVLKYMRHVGMGTERDQTPHTIGAFARVNQHDPDELRVAARMFGGVYLGLALPDTAEQEIRDEVPWTNTTGDPYSWGGHAVWLIAQDPRGLTCVTWGQEQRMSWGFFETFVDEAWSVVSEDFFGKSGKTPQGFDAAGLEQALLNL